MRANLIGKLNSKTTHFDSESDENNISDSRLGPDYADSNSIIKRYKMPINYAVCTEPDGTKPIEAANVQQPLFFYKKKPQKCIRDMVVLKEPMERTLGGVPHMPMDEKRSCGTTSLFIMTVSRHLGPKPARSNRRCGMRVIALAFFFFVRLCRIDDDKRTFYEFLSLPKFGGETCAGLITKLMKTDLTSSSSAVDGTQFGNHYLESTRRYQRS